MISHDRIASLLEQAAGGKGVLLTRRQMLGFEQVDVAELKSMLRELSRHSDHCHGSASGTIFGALGKENLGHAPSWIDAGAVYEDFLGALETNGTPDYVFCLDPWTAQLRSRAGETAPEAKWVLISDLEHRKAQGPREYWEQLEGWLNALGFADIVPRRSWEEVLAQDNLTSKTGHPPTTASLCKPGAWEWRRLDSAKASSFLFLVRSTGSLSYLRPFLDSLVRQSDATIDRSCVILANVGAEALREYLRWFALAYKRPVVSVLEAAPGDGWKEELDHLLGRYTASDLLLIEDRVLLPPAFLESLQNGPVGVLRGIPLRPEATAQIVTGNLDPVTSYEQLLQGSGVDSGSSPECARFVPRMTWAAGEGSRVSRIMSFAESPVRADMGVPHSLLKMADLS